MSFCQYHLCWGRQWVLLASPVCCSSNLSPICLVRLMPWVHIRWVFFRVEPSTNFIMLVLPAVFAFYFQGLMWLPFLPVGAQPLCLHQTQPLDNIYDCHMCILMLIHSMQRVHLVATPSAALSGSLCYSNSCSPAIQSFQWDIQLWGLDIATQSLCLPYMLGMGLIFLFHPVTQ